MARFKPRRQHRRDVLKREGFTGAEAQAMSEFKFKQPYIRLMRVDRRELVRGVRRLGLSKRASLRELRDQVDRVYEINGWKDAYSMMRDYRERAIDRGEYVPPPRRKRQPIDKGDIRRQKLRAKARKERGAISSQYDSQGRLIGDVVFNPRTGKFETRI